MRGVDEVSRIIEEACPITKEGREVLVWSEEMKEVFEKCQDMEIRGQKESFPVEYFGFRIRGQMKNCSPYKI